MNDRFTVVAGFVSTAALWEQFEIDWRLMLASYKVPYFHMKNFSQSTGPFEKWKRAEAVRRDFLRDAASIIRQRVQGGVFCFVHHMIFDRVNTQYLLRETLRSPYAAAGRACVARVELLQKDVKYVFEDGGPDKTGLLSAMGVSFTLPSPIFEPSRDITDKRSKVRKGVIQLQAADFLAYELRKHHKEFSTRSGRPVRKSFFALLNVPLWSYGFLLSEKNATELFQLGKPLVPRR